MTLSGYAALFEKTSKTNALYNNLLELYQSNISYKLVNKIQPNGDYKQIRVYKVNDNGEEIKPVVKYSLIDIEHQNNINNYIKAVE